MNKFKIATLMFILVLGLASCEKEDPVVIVEPLSYSVTQTDNPSCTVNDAEYTFDEIEITSITSDKNDIFGDLESFTDVCKTTDINPIVFANPQLKSYFFEMSFDAIYPLDSLVITNFLEDESMAIKTVDISVSLDGNSYTKIEDDYILSNTGNKETTISLNNEMVKHIKISFSSTVGEGNYGSDFFGLNDISAFLGSGYIVKEADEWTDAVTRYDGWTGADGIFSFNLETGVDAIDTPTSSTLFLYSDTILGNVNPDTFLRSNPEFLNNSIGYFNGDTTDIFNGMTFEWLEEEGEPANVFEPDSYIGYHSSNLVNLIGMTQQEDLTYTYNYEVPGSSWFSSAEDLNPSIVIDVLETTELTKLLVYNYVEDTSLSTTSIRLSYSNDNDAFTEYATYELSIPEMSNQLEPSTVNLADYIDLTGLSARYIKIDVLDNNSESVSQAGLSKILLYSNDKLLHGQVKASSYDESGVEDDPRLWLQDGVVIGDYFYTFPLLVKNHEMFFKVFKVGMIKVHIVDNQLDLESIEYLDTPLQHEQADGGITYFGCGVNNMDTSGGLSNQDGYIYVYGYKDVNGGRYLTVARVEEENFEDFNKWMYFDGESWSNDINDIGMMINGVSPELSVTYLDKGLHAGQYMLVVMKNTTSGTIAVSYSDNPTGPWTEYETVYLTSAIRELPGGFSYNAKLHPHLSEEGKYLVSYNVNTTGTSVMTNARIYHPRFIWLIETKER